MPPVTALSGDGEGNDDDGENISEDADGEAGNNGEKGKPPCPWLVGAGENSAGDGGRRALPAGVLSTEELLDADADVVSSRDGGMNGERVDMIGWYGDGDSRSFAPYSRDADGDAKPPGDSMGRWEGRSRCPSSFSFRRSPSGVEKSRRWT